MDRKQKELLHSDEEIGRWILGERERYSQKQIVFLLGKEKFWSI